MLLNHTVPGDHVLYWPSKGSQAEATIASVPRTGKRLKLGLPMEYREQKALSIELSEIRCDRYAYRRTLR